jgi:hypothetical protein
MAGLSITRRRAAWQQGIIFGATGKGISNLQEPRLQAIFQRGVQHGRANPESPEVKALVTRSQRARPAPAPSRPVRRPRPRPRHDW